MGVFEEVFAKRGATEAETVQSVEGVFEEVFVRRGRWRNTATDTSGKSSPLLDMTAFDVSKVSDPICTSPDHSSQANSPALLDPPFAEAKTPEGLEITDEFIVKNGFYSEAFDYDSLKDFLLERKVQSCPVNVNIVMGMDTEPSPKAEILNTASNYGDIDAPFILSEQHAFNTGSNYGDLDAPLADKTSLEETFNTGSNYGDVQGPLMVTVENGSVLGMPGLVNDTTFHDQGLVADDMLSSLRMRGSAIHRTILRMKVSESNKSVVEMARDGNDAHQQWEFLAGDRNDCSMEMALGQLPSIPLYEPSCDCLQRPHLPPPPPFEVAPMTTPVLRLSEAVAPPELGTPALPTIGSLLHHTRQCKPCTFFHTRGCENKEDCKFCHLCGPGEKKKRLRAERAGKRDAKTAAWENARAILAAYSDVPLGGAAYSAAEECAESDMIIE